MNLKSAQFYDANSNIIGEFLPITGLKPYLEMAHPVEILGHSCHSIFC